MERAGQTLWSALRRVARPEKPLDLLIAVWPVMVGQRLASRTRPKSWDRGRVTVAVADPEWQEQLEEMSDTLRAKINHWWGTQLVKEIRFVPGRMPKPSPSGKETPAAGRRPGPPAEAESKLRSALKELEPSLRGIADEELRELIARVAAQYLARQGKK